MKKWTYVWVTVLFVAVWVAVQFVLPRYGINFGNRNGRNIAVFVSYGIACAIIWIYTLLKKLEIARISLISDPDKKIAAIKTFMKKTVVLNESESDSDLYKENTALKVSLYNMMALAYMSKGAYDTALDIYKEAWPILAALEDYQQKSGMHPKDTCLIGLTSRLANLGHMDEAERALMPLLEKQFTDAISRCMLQSAYAELVILQKNAGKARQVLEYLAPEMTRLASIYHSKDVLCDLRLLEGKTDKLENKREAAISKFEEILQNSKNYGTLRCARQELDEIRSAVR